MLPNSNSTCFAPRNFERRSLFAFDSSQLKVGSFFSGTDAVFEVVGFGRAFGTREGHIVVFAQLSSAALILPYNPVLPTEWCTPSNVSANKSNSEDGEIRCSVGIQARSRIVVVELIVLDGIDEAKRQRLTGVLGNFEQPPNRFAPAKEYAVA